MSIIINTSLKSDGMPQTSGVEYKSPETSNTTTVFKKVDFNINQQAKIKTKPKVKAKAKIVDAPFDYQLPIISQPIADVLGTLRDVRKMATKLTKGQNKALDTAIKRTDPTGIYPGLRLQKINDLVGNGVFLAPDSKPIEPLTILGIYSGEYSVRDVSKMKHDDLNYAFHLSKIIALEKEEYNAIFGNTKSFDEDGDYVVFTDAKVKGNWTRFMNHGGRSANCIPNIGLYTYKKDGVERTDYVIVISAKNKIYPCEQLLLNYGDEYWENDHNGEELTPQTYTLDSSESTEA